MFLGDQYDIGVFFGSGYAVSRGLAPYGMFPIRLIFENPNLFEELPGIGYPPPWGLYLGLVYLAIYNPTKNLFAYNLAIKLPSIISNIALAFLIEKMAVQEGADTKTANKMFYFLLFNPLMIYISAVWGQFDALVALITMASANDLSHGKIKRSAILLALSASLKIIPLVLGPLFLLFIKRNHDRIKILEFVFLSFIALALFAFLPFWIFNWDPNLILTNSDYHFLRAGCFSLFNLNELLFNTNSLPAGWEFLGYVWIPSLALGYYALTKTRLESRMDLVRWASSLLFVLMLTRSWVSEQNIVLFFPLLLIYSVVDLKNWVFPHLTWINTLVFSFLHGSPLQMFFLLSPVPYNLLASFDRIHRTARFVLRFVAVIPWYVLGLSYVKRTFHNRRPQCRA